MKITLSRYAGFCDGVKRAYEMASSLDMEKMKKPVCILGSLAHNADVVREIEERGIKKIDREFFFNAKPGEIGTIIITAHGDGPDIFKIAKAKGINVIDTTCPKVIKVQRLAKVFSDRNYKVVIVGDKNHKEVKGINDWCGGKALLVSDKKDLENISLNKNEKIAVLSQTTQNEDFFRLAGEFIRNKFPQAEIISTICQTTEQRQKEVKKIAAENEAVIVIGSPDSANSQRLFEIAKKVNPRSYFIKNAGGIDKKWLDGVNSIAVTAGASTPQWVIREAVERIQKLDF